MGKNVHLKIKIIFRVNDTMAMAITRVIKWTQAKKKRTNHTSIHRATKKIGKNMGKHKHIVPCSIQCMLFHPVVAVVVIDVVCRSLDCLNIYWNYLSSRIPLFSSLFVRRHIQNKEEKKANSYYFMWIYFRYLCNKRESRTVTAAAAAE